MPGGSSVPCVPVYLAHSCNREMLGYRARLVHSGIESQKHGWQKICEGVRATGSSLSLRTLVEIIREVPFMPAC